MTKLLKIFVCLLVAAMFQSYGAPPPQPIQCKAISGTVSSYKIPPGPYDKGSIQVEATVDVVIQHRDGSQTIFTCDYEGPIDTDANSTFKTIIDSIIKLQIQTINWLIADPGCPECDKNNQ